MAMARKFIGILSLSLAVIILWGNKNITNAQTPPVLAFYYAWFDENTWVSGQAADIPAATYRSADAATIARHVTQAQSAGIDAFVQSWYGPQIENNQTESNFRILLDTAQLSGFQAAVDVEVMGPFFADANSVQQALTSLLSTHTNHPAYLRYNGKPVIFFWRQQRFDIETWSAIRQAVDPLHTTYWIAEGLDLNYQSVFDGMHLYSIAWAASPAAELNKWPPRLQAVEAAQGVDKLWIATAMPGYNDLNLHRADSFSRNRDGGAYYRQTWQAAQATQPDMIVITSFNEWLEGTQIEPSASYGNFYLDLTRELVSGIPAPSETAKSPPEATPTPPLTPSPASKLSAENGIYTIQSGDSLLGIAIAFEISLDELLSLNTLNVTDILSIGQTLVVSQKEEAAPTVVSPSKQIRVKNYHRIPEFW